MMHGHGGMGAHARGGASYDDDAGSLYKGEVVRRLASYLKPYRMRVTIGLVMMLVAAASQLALPAVVGWAIDNPIAQGDIPLLGLVVLGYILISIVNWLSTYSQSMAMSVAAQDVLLTLRAEMFARLMRVSQSFFDKNEVGRIMSRVQNDVNTLQELLTQGVLQLLSDFIVLFGIIAIMLRLNLKMSLVSFGVVAILVAITYFWQGMARRAHRNVRAAISLVNGALQENISGVRVVQSMSREDTNLREFDALNRKNFMANVRAGQVAASLQPVVEIVNAIALSSVIIYGGSLVLGGEMSVGDLVAFSLYINRFFEPIRDLTNRFTTLQQAMASGERIFEVLDTPVTVDDPANPVRVGQLNGTIDLDRVSFQYTEGVPVLQDISLHIPEGSTIALVGQTGAGKSTIVNLVARFYDVTGGAVRIDGTDVREMRLFDLRSQIGWVAQDPFLFSGTVRDNLRFGKLDATDEEIEEAARAIGAHDFISRLSKGYDTDVRERGGLLSVGQRQLVSFVRALLADPRILILDEATANIDTTTEAIIQQGLERLLKGRTSLVIAHRLSTIKNADIVVVLEHGRIAEQGTHEELLAREGIYHRLYTMTYAPVAA